MHGSTTRQISQGNRAQAVAITYGRLPSNVSAVFYAVDKKTDKTYNLGSVNSPDGQLWSLDWTPQTTSDYYVYSELRNRDGVIADTGRFLILPKGSKAPPYRSVAGTYQALLPGDAQPMLMVELAANGGLSGRLVLDGLTYPFKGTLSSSGTATISSDLKSQPRLTLVLRSDSTSRMLSGNYRLGSQAAVEFTLMPPAYTGKGRSVSPLAKKTANALLAPELGAGSDFLGYGYFRATFDATGGARLVGKMPDGRVVSSYHAGLSTGISRESVLPVSIVWKGKRLASLKGELEVRENPSPAVPLLEGVLDWSVPADSRRAILPKAYSASLVVAGNLWRPVAGRNALTSSNSNVNFTLSADPDARIAAKPHNFTGTWRANNTQALSGLPAKATWKYEPATGLFSGKLPRGNASDSFSGLVVPLNGSVDWGDDLRGAGFMIGKSASVPVEITSK